MKSCTVYVNNNIYEGRIIDRPMIEVPMPMPMPMGMTHWQKPRIPYGASMEISLYSSPAESLKDFIVDVKDQYRKVHRMSVVEHHGAQLYLRHNR